MNFRHSFLFWGCVAAYSYAQPALLGGLIAGADGRLFFSLGWLLWAVFTPLIFQMAQRYNLTRPRLVIFLPMQALFSVGVSLAFMVVFRMGVALGVQVGLTSSSVPEWSFAGAYPVYWLIALVAYGWAFYRRFHQLALDNAELERALVQARLDRLQTQLQPHFLFNSLNNIRALVNENPPAARQAITELAGVLRYAVDASQHRQVPFERELQLVESYLCVEKIHFEERLAYAFEVDPATRSLPIPPLLVQGLVENAVKHGIAQRPEGGTIRVRSALVDGDWHVAVVNSGQVVPQARPGVGLQNLKSQLNLLYPAGVRFSLQNADDRSVIAQFIVSHAHLPG